MEDEDVPRPLAFALYGFIALLFIATIIGEIFFYEEPIEIDLCYMNNTCETGWEACLDSCVTQVEILYRNLEPLGYNRTKELFDYYYDCSNECTEKWRV
jgi:hypothetical protein